MDEHLPQEAVDLYALDPGEFTAARNRLVKQLRADGRREEATTVSALRRPTPVAWALDQVVRQQPELVSEALEAGRRLHEATEAVAAGADQSVDGLRTTMEDEQAASAGVVEAALVHLGERGATLRPKVLSTLRAAVLDEQIGEQLRRGVLSADHESTSFGFGFDLGLEASAPPARPANRSSGAGRRSTAKRTGRSERADEPDPAERQAADAKEARRREETERRDRRRALRQRVRELRDRADDLDRAASRAEAEAQQARQLASEAAHELDEAQRRLDES